MKVGGYSPIPILFSTDKSFYFTPTGSGYVEEIGQAVRSVRPGDPVILSFLSCGNCYNCHDNHPAYCIHCWDCNFSGEKDMYAGRDSKSFNIGGSFFGQSSFASMAIVKERSVVRLTDADVTKKSSRS